MTILTRSSCTYYWHTTFKQLIRKIAPCSSPPKFSESHYAMLYLLFHTKRLDLLSSQARVFFYQYVKVEKVDIMMQLTGENARVS
ncbi:hypothetical protein BS17DRAFT_788618 [Gyrodon lividus]|nr:hypothetical protein BS17DRAFT_788618 [Gyrodon lividus]